MRRRTTTSLSVDGPLPDSAPLGVNGWDVEVVKSYSYFPTSKDDTIALHKVGLIRPSNNR